MTEQTENATRLARPLIRLAKLVGVATSYVGMSHDYHEIEDDVLVAVLGALGIDASNDEAINQSITSIKSERETRVVAPTVLHVVGKESKVEVHGGMFDVPEASITLENGKQFTGKISHEGGEKIAHEINGSFFFTSYLVLPADLPEGYHTLEVTVGSETETATVISAPEKIELLDDMKNGSLWGWMSQLYSIRSKGSWGVGDFEDLKTMLVEAKKKTGSDFMLINPMHAAEPVPPLTPSPYLPISRRFITFSYIRPESMPEYLTLSHEDRAEVDALHEQVELLNDDARLIDRDAMWRVKKHALWVIYKAGRTKARQAEFDRYLAECGDEIESYATWCLCYDKWGAPSDDADNWVRKYNRDSEEVAQLREKFPDTLEFYRWLEWVATDQLHAAQQAARKAGMKIGIVADMAVGVHPAGSDVWWNPERFAKGATVGAPPDMFNQQGQDWSQPPLNPIALEQTGFRVYRDMVHGMFANAGAVRIDHILGLFRLWWIPEGKPATDGTYVHYDSDVMLGILALEASRAGGVVVGEDLGISTCPAEDLDLPGARNGVAVTDGHRRRVLERLGQIAAGHLAETRERDHLALDDAVALDEIAAEVPFDHDIFEGHALRTEGEFDLIDAAFDADRVVDVAQVGGHEFVVALHPVQLESALRVGAGADRRSGPVDRSSDQRLFVRIADHAPQILGVQRTANGEGRKRKE